MVLERVRERGSAECIPGEDSAEHAHLHAPKTPRFAALYAPCAHHSPGQYVPCDTKKDGNRRLACKCSPSEPAPASLTCSAVAFVDPCELGETGPQAGSCTTCDAGKYKDTFGM